MTEVEDKEFVGVPEAQYWEFVGVMEIEDEEVVNVNQMEYW